MTSTLPPDMLERIDGVCDRFESACKAGQRPRVEDYVGGEGGAEREALVRELTRVEEHYRRRGLPATAVLRQCTPPAADRPMVPGYDILGELGRGGMGVVYQARQLRPNRLVALKMISAGVHAGPREIERFRSEADAVAQLQHANIVQLYEIGEQEGRPYLAMEYVAGGSLDRWLAGTPQPPRATAWLVEQLALAIQHAHHRGIVHRDLKPANVLLQKPDAPADLQVALPKITDFGLAKLLDAGAFNPTHSGELLGTPNYMAPEQVGGGGQTGAATDVYGLGAILYECLTGRPPFRGETALETMLQVQKLEPVSPSRLAPRCPRDLVTICLKCLAKEPRHRYAAADDLARDLRRFLDGKPILARPVGPLTQVVKWTRRQPLVAGLTAMLLLAVTAGMLTGSWFWWQAEKGRAMAETALGNERAAQAARAAALDRYRVALAHREWLANDAGRAAALLDACTPQQRQTWEWRYLDRIRNSALHTFHGHTATAQAVAVHPSGRRIASAAHDGTVREWDLDAQYGWLVGVHPFPGVLAVTYSPDGRLLASSDGQSGRIMLWDLETGVHREVSFGRETQVRGLAFDSSSRYLAAGGNRRLRVWDTADLALVYDKPETNLIWQVAFTPDGNHIATTSKRLKLWDWKKKDAVGPVLEWPEDQSLEGRDLTIDPRGGMVALAAKDSLVRVYNLRDRSEAFTLNAHPHYITSVSFNHDGSRLATSGQEGDMHVWDVQTRRRLFTLHGHSGAVWDLTWSPNSKHLISVGSDALVRVWDTSGTPELTPLPVKGTGEIKTLEYGAGGRLIAWADAAGGAGIWDLKRRRPVFRIHTMDRTLRPRVSSFAFCPTGRRVALRPSAGPPKMWQLDGRGEVILQHHTDGQIVGLAFSADGGQLLAAYRKERVVEVRDLLTGQTLLSLSPPGAAIKQILWSPDVRSFLTVDAADALCLWHTGTGALRANLGTQPAKCITFSHNGRSLALGDARGDLRVWDLLTNRQVMAVTGVPGGVYGLALSPDGSRLASAGSDCTARLWDTATGEEVLTLRTDLHFRSPLAFSPGGQDIVSVNVDQQLQVWTANTALGTGSVLSRPEDNAGAH